MNLELSWRIGSALYFHLVRARLRNRVNGVFSGNEHDRLELSLSGKRMGNPIGNAAVCTPAKKCCGIADLALVHFSPALAGSRVVRPVGSNPVAGIKAQTTGAGIPAN